MPARLLRLLSALENANTILLGNEDYDVFDDGSVRIISAPRHTPCHQVWIVHDKTIHSKLTFAPAF